MRDLAVGPVRDDALRVGGRLLRGDASGDDGVEHWQSLFLLALQAFDDLALHVPVGVFHGDQGADDLQSGIEGSRVRVLAEEQVETFRGQVLCAHGHDETVGCDHVVGCEVAKVRRAVDDDDVVFRHDRFEDPFEDGLTSHGDG